MWKGPVTEDLRALAIRYANAHNGFEPDGYEELLYDTMTYDEFL